MARKLRDAARSVVRCGTLFAACTWAEPALAYTELPGYFQNVFELDCAPSCLLCHTRPEGGDEYIRPSPGEFADARGYGAFVQNLMASYREITLGLPTQQEFAAALEVMRTAPCPPNTVGTPTLPCDSDGDTKSDIDEVSSGQDPDDARGDASLCIGPRYGCGAHVASAPPSEPATRAWLAALGLALVLRRRTRA